MKQWLRMVACLLAGSPFSMSVLAATTDTVSYAGDFQHCHVENASILYCEYQKGLHPLVSAQIGTANSFVAVHIQTRYPSSSQKVCVREWISILSLRTVCSTVTQPFPYDQLYMSAMTVEVDHDGDVVINTNDNCPATSNENQLNTDNDSQGNACDSDDDNDTVTDVSDAFPLNPAEWLDTDSDTFGNNADWDDDNDGVPDVVDAAALDGGNAGEITLPLDGTYKGGRLGSESLAP